MTAATNVSGVFFDAVADYVGTKGYVSYQAIFTWASNASATYAASLENDPIETGAALIAGLAAVAVFGPTVSVAIMMETLADYLQGVMPTAGIEFTVGALTSYFA